MRIIVFVLCVLIPTPCFGVVLFSDDFDDSDDWTVTQPSGSAANCTSSCGVPGGWDMYRNGVCLCGAEISGEPGNNLFYIDQYSGYPNETNACRGSTGKCLSMWSESCSDVYDQSDGILSVDLGDEYSDIYVRFYIKFKPNWELRGLIGDDGPIQKFLHIQHYDPVESANPYIYHDASDPNEPVGVLQTGQYTTTIKMNGVARCNPDYYCYSDIIWNLGSVTAMYAEGGIYDGDWHAWEVRYAMNSDIGATDGLVELWIDGTKKTYLEGYEGDEIPWNSSESAGMRGWRLISLGGNTNNQFDASCSDMADCEQWYAIDDVVIATEYIGLDAPAESAVSMTGVVITGGNVH